MAIRSEDADLRVRYANVLRSCLRLAAARQQYEQVLERMPDHVEALVNLTNLTGVLGERDVSMRSISSAHPHGPGTGELSNLHAAARVVMTVLARQNRSGGQKERSMGEEAKAEAIQRPPTGYLDHGGESSWESG